MLDLQAPIFTQAAVLELLPELPAKTLQNWLSRNIVTLEVHNPGRQAKRYYTAYGVIVLGFMSAAILKKIDPTYSVQMGYIVANRALEYFSNDLVSLDDTGIPLLVYPSKDYRNCQRHFVKNHEDKFFLSPVGDEINADSWLRTVEAPFYQVIETDIFIIDMINRILRWQANCPEKASKSHNDSRDGRIR